ncbi:hypothetical protein BKA70DRAFT_1370631 [Coprinopsis sp. MPI-PUGE-AT-0042]|nr:hypothetical protein BKA70DRAFT_1370631 [Coprinopsis sp. MPI-PUGE-AT-0042]
METPQTGQGIAILRIKRRRDEEPLDALVVEAGNRRKRTKGPGVFQYAETVEDKDWQNELSQRQIQEKLARLAKEATSIGSKKPAGAPVTDRSSPLMKRQESGVGKRYTIVEAEAPMSPTATQSSPPPVPGSKDQNTKDVSPDFKMYDAILATPAEERELDPEMEKFQAMLNDYLRVNDVNISHKQGGPSLDTVMKSPGTEESDYVWDVFYHRPVTLAEWNEMAANIATLYGFPAEGDDYSTGSESELEDNADEDSNDESFYKNDYPDEEDDYSSDEFSDDSSDEGGGFVSD